MIPIGQLIILILLAHHEDSDPANFSSLSQFLKIFDKLTTIPKR